MGLVVIVVKVVRIVKGLTITRVIGIRLPVRCEFSRLAERGDGGRAMVAEEVASTEDAHRELLVGKGSSGSIGGEGSKESGLRIKKGKVKEDVSVINREEHGGVAHGGT